jgi:hypothetical protein
MTNEELSGLIAQIQHLIDAYEVGSRKALANGSLAQTEAIALSLHASPLHDTEYAMNAMDAASLTPEEMESAYAKGNSTTAFNKTQEEKVKKSPLEKPFFEYDCDTVGTDEWYTPGTTSSGELIEFGDKRIPKKVGVKFTNPVNLTLTMDPLFGLKDIVEPNNKNKITDCFDCDLKFTVQSMYPSLELLWEFDKLLKGITDAIAAIKKATDPSSIYSQICDIKAFVGANFLCPSLMAKMNLILPTLFMKYSLDLGKISIDANFLLGGILKVLISAIATFLENIRALIIPFIDCAINSAKAVSGYIKAVSKLIANSIDQVGDIADKATQAMHKAAILTGEIFSNDPFGATQDVQDKISETKALHNQLANLKKDYAILKAKLKGEALEETKKLKKAELAITKTQILLGGIPKEWGGTYSGSFENNPLIKAFMADGQPDSNIRDLSSDEFQTKLSTFLAKYFDENHIGWMNPKKALINLLKDSDKEDKDFIAKEVEINDKITESMMSIKNTHKESLNSLTYKMAIRDKKIFDWKKMFRTEAAPPGKQRALDFLKTRYSFNVENSYVDHEYAAIADSKEFLKDYSSSAGLKLAKLIDNYVIKYLQEAKNYVNDFFGNIINMLKNLNIILDQNTFSQFKILGEILQLAHLIRAFKLIEKLISEGFDGCEKSSITKTQEEILKQAIEEISSDTVSARVDVVKASDSNTSETQHLKIIAKKSGNVHLVDRNDCQDIHKSLNTKNESLDRLYDMMRQEMV